MSVYFGSKATPGLYQNIIAIMPPHETYIESHLGGGTIMKKKPSAPRNIGIDRDAETIASFTCDYPVELHTECSHQFLRNFAFTGKELIYCDPPYLIETRRSPRRYRFDYTEEDHIELLKLLKSLPCQIILSGYPSSLYDEYLSDWNNIELQVMSHSGPRTEKIWYNYTIDRTFWPTYAGRNFTHRQAIKRKAQRWGKNYEKLPREQRLAIMATLMDIEASRVSEDRSLKNLT